MSDEILSPSNEGNFSGSVHTSTSNIISYSIYAATACLAFFFLFAAALFSGYMLAYSTFGVVVKSTGSVIGRIVLTGICVVAIVFSIWSYQVVRTFLNFFSAMLESGAALENANKLRGGIYEKLRNVYAGPGAHKSLRLWTTSFFLVFFLAWIVLFVFAWV